uniref:DUF4371 domain-containing protein n=1 Tax=Astyanax mexicanus TaxID=7994 RepID=A0A3B1KBC7_ASTMX
MAEQGPSRKKAKTYNFHQEWENEFLFTTVKDKTVCLICQQCDGQCCTTGHQQGSWATEGKKKWHWVPKLQVPESPAVISGNQRHLPLEKANANTEASFRVSHLLAKHKKTFTDGELFKEAMLFASDSLFRDFKNKDEIRTAISNMSLGPATVVRRVELLSEDISKQVLSDLSRCEYFSLQFDESVDITDTAQLVVFVRMTFSDASVKEDFLTLLPLNERTRGEDIYRAFRTYATENDLPFQKLVSITRDGAPAMCGIHAGFIALCRKDPIFPAFVSYHCVIHQQALASKVVDFSHVMTVVVKIVNSIRAKALQHRLFKSLLDELDAEYGDLILHADVRWLSRGKVLQRFINLLPEIISFLKSRKEEYRELADDTWLLDLAFLTDLTSKLNELNCELQGKDCDVPHMVSAVNAFKVKLALWTSQLKCKKLTHFQNVDKMLNNISNKDSFHPENFCIHLNRLEEEFSKRFEELNKDIIEELSAKFQQVFELPNGVDMEIIDLENDIEMKARSRDKDFWGLVSRERYPSLSACALKVKAFFGSTYFCEMSFPQMKIIKSKYRTCLTDAHLTDCVRLAVSNYTPDYKAPADSVQPQNFTLYTNPTACVSTGHMISGKFNLE